MNRMFDSLRKYKDAGSRFADFRALLNFNDSLSNKWKILSRVLRLHFDHKSKLCGRVLSHYKWIFTTDNKTPYSALRDFSQGMLFPSRMPTLKEYSNFLSELQNQHTNRFDRFVVHYKKELFKHHIARYLQIFDDYFRDYSEYKQTLNYIRCGIELPEGSYASSRGFDRVRMFYGNAFEILTSHFVIPACLNNICNNREFHQFAEMDLSLYTTIDKANRAEPFKNNSKLKFLLEGVDTGLRNASHHADIRLLKGHDIIEYRSGKKRKKKTMAYVRYIHLCNTLIINLFIMLDIELQLKQM